MQTPSLQMNPQRMLLMCFGVFFLLYQLDYWKFETFPHKRVWEVETAQQTPVQSHLSAFEFHLFTSQPELNAYFCKWKTVKKLEETQFCARNLTQASLIFCLVGCQNKFLSFLVNCSAHDVFGIFCVGSVFSTLMCNFRTSPPTSSIYNSLLEDNV